MNATLADAPTATSTPTAAPRSGLAAQVAQEDLARALAFVRTAGAGARRGGRHVLLQHDGTALTVTGGDHDRDRTVEASVRLVCPGRKGRVVALAADLPALVKAIGRRATVHLSVGAAAGDDFDARTGTGRRLFVEGADASYAVPLGHPDDDWSDLDAGPAVLLATMTGEAMAAAARPAYAASPDETLPILTAVRVHLDDGHIVTAATDRYRLARAAAPATVAEPVAGLLVPARPLAALADRWRAERAVWWHRLDGPPGQRDYVRWSSGEETWTQLAVDGEYPRIDQLLPDVTGARVWVDVDRVALLTAFARVSVLAAMNDPLRLALVSGPDGATLRVTSTSHGGEARTAVTVTGWAEPDDNAERITIALNRGFAPGLLRSLTATTVRLVFHESQPTQKPVVALQSPVRPAPAADDLAATPEPDDLLVSLLMPVRMAG
ncbi:hypothetical protein [Pseudokineococcus lusitanus]|uniref:DNA polymerase III sliding clamp (Beta) subunit (PCNA family) n=1 Tax=Pseudokineococcus lusitanus TaxID=763993 RepID=A0A3N1HTS2_9ACTN|nr:hypothetical protein [Pseudokineococcus lusitanus]ROP45928.1 DNA polymerase III sliding clamp (beta) subunit (PCNA family) [Pseudokineococcus lusitanus]